MNKLSKLAAAVALSAVVLGSFTTEVGAQTVEQNQELDQTVTVNCTTGAYGQSTTCTAEGTQRGVQNQRVTLDGVNYFVRADGRYIRVHQPVNTSVSSLAMAGIIAAAVTAAGTGLVIAKKK